MHAGERVEIGEREVERGDIRGQLCYPLFLGLPARTYGQERVCDRDVQTPAEVGLGVPIRPPTVGSASSTGTRRSVSGRSRVTARPTIAPARSGGQVRAAPAARTRLDCQGSHPAGRSRPGSHPDGLSARPAAGPAARAAPPAGQPSSPGRPGSGTGKNSRSPGPPAGAAPPPPPTAPRSARPAPPPPPAAPRPAPSAPDSVSPKPELL
jgi:hypothetical protein